jgi:RNA polymerase-binding transcription factor DksA
VRWEIFINQKEELMAKKPAKAAAKTAAKKRKPVARGIQGKKAKPAKTRVAQAVTKKPAARLEDVDLGPKAFSAAELKHFREIIVEKRKETIEELDALKESMMDVTTGEYISESSNYSLHMEQGTDAMEREKTFLFASRSSKFVVQLDDALGRIDAGTYGTCKVCGLLVPKERLEAVPTATTCAEYKNTGVPCARGQVALARKHQGK